MNRTTQLPTKKNYVVQNVNSDKVDNPDFIIWLLEYDNNKTYLNEVSKYIYHGIKYKMYFHFFINVYNAVLKMSNLSCSTQSILQLLFVFKPNSLDWSFHKV